MSITADRFAQGMTYEAYKAQMTRNRERLEANEQRLDLGGDDLEFFTHLSAPLNVIAIGEDWCGDVINNLPVLNGLAVAGGKLNLRVFLRDQNLDLMDQYLKDGTHRSIPVFAFFDESFNPIGHWIERPASVSVLHAEMFKQLYAEDPAFVGIAPETAIGELPEAARLRLMQAFGTFREEHHHFSDREVVRELRAIVSGGTQATEAPRAALAKPNLPQKRERSAGTPIKVSITYCAACGYEPQTLALASALMNAFVYDLASIELIPWQDGSFDVVVDGDLIHSMYREGGFPEHATIIAAVRARMGSIPFT
ncbi:MAG: SelT/SelW/SelH family protein [Chloroflexales bacterium]